MTPPAERPFDPPEQVEKKRPQVKNIKLDTDKKGSGRNLGNTTKGGEKRIQHNVRWLIYKVKLWSTPIEG